MRVCVCLCVSKGCGLVGATSKLLELTSPELPAAPSDSQVQAEPVVSQVGAHEFFPCNT